MKGWHSASEWVQQQLFPVEGIRHLFFDSTCLSLFPIASQAEINVGYAPSGTVEILPRALHAFRGSFPGVRVTLHDLSAKDMLPLLLEKKLEIALTLPPQKLPRELAMKELARYEPCVVVGTRHPLAKLKFVSLNQIASNQSRL